MKTPLHKKEENRNQHVNNETTQKKSQSQPNTQLGDKRPEVIAQRELQEKAANSAQVKQLNAFQNMVNNSPRMTEKVQLKSSKENTPSNIQEQPIQQKKNNTGLPDNLKSGVENLSGISMDDVKVHYNSSKPAQLQAHAYAQGTNIHLGPGQEKHLPHEAWHVVQQKQGRVQPTKQMKSKVNINDDAGLEKEADVMGAKALQAKSKSTKLATKSTSSQTIQQVKDKSKRTVMDKRIEELREETVKVLEEYKKEGADYESKYGKEGKEKAEQKTKDKLAGKKEESLSSKVKRRILKEFWDSLSVLDKAKLAGSIVGAGATVVGAGVLALGKGLYEAAGLAADSSGGQKEKESESKNESSDWLDEITDERVEKLFEAYKLHREYSKKFDEAKDKVISTAGELGEAVGKKAGQFRDGYDFSTQLNENRPKFKVAFAKLKSLDEEIKENDDENRYKEITTTLFKILGDKNFVDLSIIDYIDAEKRQAFMKKCTEAIRELKSSSIDKGGFLGRVLEAVESLPDRISESLPSESELNAKQTSLYDALDRLTKNAKWKKVTGNPLKPKPDGVWDIEKELLKPGTPQTKIQLAINKSKGFNLEKKRPTPTKIFYELMQKITLNNIGEMNKIIADLDAINESLNQFK